MRYLRKKGDKIEKKDYYELKQLLEIVGSAIHEFRAFKSEIFKFITLKQIIAESEKKVRNSASLVSSTKNSKISDYQLQFASSVIYGIREYTPFFIFRLLTFILQKITLIYTRKQINRKVKRLTEIKDWLENSYSEKYIPKLK